MFNNIGKKIQGLSSTIFAIELLVFCLVGLYVGVGLVNTTNEPMFLLVGIAVAGVGIFLSWLSQLVLYAYGKIAECCEEQLKLTRQMLELQMGKSAAPSEEKICKSCGTKLDADASFCHECGTPYRD